MAFQTNVLRDGEWVTETVSLQAALKANADNASQSTQRVAVPFDCGILTKTVVESPVAHWILPVRLRTAQHMDVACVGDHYVTICELEKDRLKEVARKNDFCSRIRNAKVIGSLPESRADDDDDDDDIPDIKVETEQGPGPVLPPQQLMLILESGDFVFLFLTPGPVEGEFEFVSVRYQPPRSQIIGPGFHAAVDPSSRFMALSCLEDLFVVYELESQRELARCYALGEPLRPIKSFQPRTVKGVIHSMEFLFPLPDDDDYHILLLLIISRNGRSRMVTFEWEADENLQRALRGEEKRGHPLPPQYNVPLLIIPLTVHSAFFAICTDRVGVCKNAQNVPAEFDDFMLEQYETSRFFHGRGQPLWTAWTRPYRLPKYKTKRDNIYLAREDGVVMFLDIDSDNILGASVQIGQFECNISTSFCSLPDDFNDILIMGGDSGPGTVWQIRPRQPNHQLGTIPNWSPVADFIVTKDSTALSRLDSSSHQYLPLHERPYQKPQRLFATSGRGVSGAITEFRHGIRANIGLDMDFETPVKSSWVFRTRDEDTKPAFNLLLSLVDKSMALFLPGNLSDATALDDAETPYDLTTQTVAAMQLADETIVQVTEKFLVVVAAGNSARHLHATLLEAPDTVVSDACIHGNMIALSSYTGSSFRIHLLQLGPDRSVRVLHSFDQHGDVGCLSLGMVGDLPTIVAGISDNGNPALSINQLQDKTLHRKTIDVSSVTLRFRDPRTPRDPDESTDVPLEPLASCAVFSLTDCTVISAGTRGGDVALFVLDAHFDIVRANWAKFGRSTVHMSMLSSPNRPNAALIWCDGQLCLMPEQDAKNARFNSTRMVWPVDMADGTKPPPPITSVSVLPEWLPDHQDTTQLVLTSKSRVMVAEMHHRPSTVPRYFPVCGTPQKLIHSEVLDCLIVAVKDSENRPTLQFLDIDSGEDLSFPTDKNTYSVDFVSGLGKPGDEILGLSEWQYERQGDKWTFILAATLRGRLLVLSATPSVRNADGKRTKIRYWTRFKRSSYNSPIYSVLGAGNSIFYCAGRTLYWEVLDVAERRLKTNTTIELPSPAHTLQITCDSIVALTESHSIEVIGMNPGDDARLELRHADPGTRFPRHMLDIGVGRSSLILVSDSSCGLAGLWVPWSQPGKDCSVLFEADLPASIVKLSSGLTRPSWIDTSRTSRYGHIPSAGVGLEVLGACLDGSVQHVSLLAMSAWRVLRLVQNLAALSPTLYPFTYDDANGWARDQWEPRHNPDSSMQVDGDMLQRCLDKRALEKLFTTVEPTKRLFQLMDDIEGGVWTAGFPCKKRSEEVDGESATRRQEEFEEDRRCYLALLYDILEYYLTPVI